MITYADIQSLYRTEGKTPTLAEIPEDFYGQVVQLLSQVGQEHKEHIKKFTGEICSRRRKKIILHALRTCDKNNLPVNITPSEKELYLNIVDLMQKHSDNLLSEKSIAGAKPVEAEKKEKKIKVRVLKPMPSIVGSDMNNYGPFKEDDIHELPESNANILIKNEYAEEYVETTPPAEED